MPFLVKITIYYDNLSFSKGLIDKCRIHQGFKDLSITLGVGSTKIETSYSACLNNTGTNKNLQHLGAATFQFNTTTNRLLSGLQVLKVIYITILFNCNLVKK